MTIRIYQVVLMLALCIAICFATSPSQPAGTYEDTYKLLLKMEDALTREVSLTKLFGVGDERIQDLIRALNEPNEAARRNAQIVIRYLGNDAGMKAVIESYRKSKAYSEVGPVPLPLSNWDYELIRNHYLTKARAWDQRATSYIYALALDESTDAVALLREWNKEIEQGVIPYHYAMHQVKAIRPGAAILGDTDLAKLVADNAFFVNSDERRHISSKLMGFNHARNKALIKVNVGEEPLGTEQYHVVLQKRGEAWRFYSVTPISVS
jgi:hypothetical protein